MIRSPRGDEGGLGFQGFGEAEGGSRPQGGRPDHRQGAPRLRPPSLPTRRETRGRRELQGVRCGQASWCRRLVKAVRAAAGPRVWEPLASRREWQWPGGRGSGLQAWCGNTGKSPTRSHSRQPRGLKVWPKWVAFLLLAFRVLLPAATRCTLELSPGEISTPSCLLIFFKRSQWPIPASCLFLPPTWCQGRPPGGRTRWGLPG